MDVQGLLSAAEVDGNYRALAEVLFACPRGVKTGGPAGVWSVTYYEDLRTEAALQAGLAAHAESASSLRFGPVN